MFLERRVFVIVLYLGTCWYITCASIRVAARAAFFVVRGFVIYWFSDKDEPALYWALSLSWGYHSCKQTPYFTSTFFSIFLALIQVDVDVMLLPARSSNPSKVYGKSVVERSCLKLLRLIHTNSC